MSRLQGIVSKVEKLPFQQTLLSFVLGNVVKFVGTAGIKFEKMTETKVQVSLKNKRKVQNHIGQVHAAAMMLLAETATGMVLGMNVSDECVPVIKSMNIAWTKRSKGALRATATLNAEQIALIKGTEKGETAVSVHLTDEEGKEPVNFEVVWAWTPKRK